MIQPILLFDLNTTKRHSLVAILKVGEQQAQASPPLAGVSPPMAMPTSATILLGVS